MLGLGFNLAAAPVLGGGPPFSLKLDGTDDHMRVDHNTSIKPTAAITVAGWVNLDLVHGATGWLNPDGNSDHDEYLIGTVNNGGWGMYFSYGGTAANPKTEIKAIINVTDTGSGSAGYLTAKWGGVTSTTGSTTLHEIKDFTGWVHLVFTYDGAILKLYINGNNDLNEGDVDTSGTQVIDSGVTGKAARYTINTPVMVGTDALNATIAPHGIHFLAGGLIDDVAIWSAAVDSDGVAVIYNSGKAGLNLLAASGNYDNEADLEAWWKFEEGSGTTVADSSSNSNEGTLVNSPSFSDNTSE